MTWENVADVAAMCCFVGAAVLTLAAGVGVLRFDSLLSRLHAGTKPQALGVMLAMIGLALRLRTEWASSALVLIVLFQLGTAPVAAHMLGRAGVRLGQSRSEDLELDELADDDGRSPR